MARDNSKTNDYQKQYREKRKQEGKCARCSNPIAQGSSSRCSDCLQYAKNWQKSRRGNNDTTEVTSNAKSTPTPAFVYNDPIDQRVNM